MIKKIVLFIVLAAALAGCGHYGGYGYHGGQATMEITVITVPAAVLVTATGEATATAGSMGPIRTPRFIDH